MADDILIVNASILSLDSVSGQSALLGDAYLAVADSKIRAVGTMAELATGARRLPPAGLTLDAAGQLVMPGLVNCHTHAAMTLFRGLADDLPLQVWLNEHIFPAEARFATSEMVYWCTKLAAAEMILSGTTTVADGYFHEQAAAAAFRGAGLRAVAAQGIIDFPAPGVSDPAKNLEAAEAFAASLDTASGLITPAIFCHSPYTCGSSTLRQAKKLARRLGMRLFIHVAETEEELRQVRRQQGASPVGYLEKLGILDEETVCVHCVWLDDEDIKSLGRTGARVVTCPESNMKLAAGIAPLSELLARGVAVGLGTDSCASNNNLDLFSEMDMCAKLHKVHERKATALPARQLLHLATAGGARVLGLTEVTGTLTPGKAADLILLDLNQPHLTPCYNPDLLVYSACGHDVRTAIINGRLVMQDRRILSFDVEEAMNRVRELSRAVLTRNGESV